MIKMMAIGVSQARMLDCSAVAPVRNGNVCARAILRLGRNQFFWP
jgi:hypothetical protein